MRWLLAALAGSLVVTCGAGATAQTLPEYLRLARERALELEEARQLAREAEARSEAADRALLPSLSADATYRWNRDEETVSLPTGPDEEFEEVVLVPRNQISAGAAVEVPLIDVGAWTQRSAAEDLADAARRNAAEVQNEIARRVAEAYYQYVGASALVASSEAALDAARAHRSVVRGRLEAGLATELDVERAEAQVARSRQTLAEAGLAETDAARELRVLTGVIPAEAPPLPADRPPEPPLKSWLADASELPRVEAARAEARAQAAEARAANLFYVPEVDAFAEERYTSGAAGFTGPTGFSVGVRAEWRLDFASFRLAEAARGAAGAAERRADIALRDARAEIEAAWQRVRALESRLEAAAREAEASARAAEIARETYPARASQLDVVLAERDALAADVERIRAAADLAYARARLRIAAGRAGELER